MSPMVGVLVWIGLVLAVVVPISLAALSPLLAWRDPVYIAAGFAGIIAMTLMLVQPLLAAGLLPELTVPRGRRIHRWVGGALVMSVIVHVVGLWLTSPPDVIDALLFVSPTPFSMWGVIAMWGVFVTAGLALMRTRLKIRPRTWRLSHRSLAAVIVCGTVIHALKIEGTMELWTKSALCVLVALASIVVLLDLKRR